ncbi:DNA polymerase [Pelagibacterales bacterium]|nr:DNA polymerase [Pelagibacterales bacterium]
MNKPLQMPMFSPQTEWVPPLNLPDLKEYSEIAIDLETRDPNLMTMGSGSVRGDGEVVGIAIAVEGWSGYFPIAHEAGGNMDRGLVLDWFEEVLHTDATKIFHNAMYDVSWIRSLGFQIRGGIIDTMIAASLVNENRWSFTLDSISKEFIGMGKNEKILAEAAKAWGVNPKAEMWRLPAPLVGEYAERDAEVTLKLWHALQHEITQQDLWDVFNMETNLFPCLVDMKFKGVRVDAEKAAALKKQLTKTEKDLHRDIKKLIGFEVEIWAASSIQKAFDNQKIPYDRTDKGAPSFTKNFLATHPHELPKLINEAREINKANTTFIETILKHEHNGRIHSDINQIRSDDGGTVTGRFSYSNPNLQQIPARHKELGPMIRSLFIPEQGHKWGCFDYSQQEPRIVVHFSSLLKLEGSSMIVDQYNNGEADFHQMIADMAGIERKQAKTINLGLMYGMGKNKLMAELGLLKEAAEDLIKTYHRKAPFVKMLSEAVTRRAEDSGKIRTIGGRLCHFDMWEPHGYGIKKALPHADALREHGPGIKRAFTYKALNKLIQGSAADMTKKAMLALYEEGVIPHIQIHDELDISVDSPEQIEKIINIMEDAVQLEVPNKVDYEEGDSWGDIH